MKMQVLKFYMSSTDKLKHDLLYEAIAFAAKRYGLGGATVYKGVMGYGMSSELRSDKFWEFQEKVPVVVEIIDYEDKIEGFLKASLPYLDLVNKGCLVTLGEVDVVLQKRGH